MTEGVIHEIEWDPAPVLLPGFDHQDGVTYITVPVVRNKLVPSKKKGSPPDIVKGLDTLAVTSERKTIWFDSDGLEDAGFTPPAHMFQERETRWSYGSIKSYLDGGTEAPASRDLFAAIKDVYTTYAEYASEVYFTILPLYIMYTYVFRLFDTTGYLHFNGTAASGKSRNLNIINALAFNAVMASSMSGSSLFRKVAGQPGVMCLDESESFDGERGSDLRTLLLGGYMKSGKALRSEKGAGDRWESVEFPTFGPKALASINTLDATFASRCMVIEMRPAVRSIPDFPMHASRWNELRDQLYLWTMENADGIAALSEEWNGARKRQYAPTLISRSWEITKPIIVLADYVGGIEMAQPLIDFFVGYFAKQQQSLDATDRLRTTLRALPRVIAKMHPHAPGLYYSSKDIHETISSYMEEDAREYFKTRHVGKNLEVLGFKEKRRAAGGVQYLLDENQIRDEFTQRRVQPFEEDTAWLEGSVSYQTEQPSIARSTSVWDGGDTMPWEDPS